MNNKNEHICIDKNIKIKHERPMRIYQIVLDGIDKTGKDLIKSYIYYLGKARYICTARGIISMRAYSRIYNRPYKYSFACQKNIMNVYLTVDKQDWEVRCKASHEPIIDYDQEIKIFNEEANKVRIQPNSFYRTYNTSEMTPFQVAQDILDTIDLYNHVNE